MLATGPFHCILRTLTVLGTVTKGERCWSVSMECMHIGPVSQRGASYLSHSFQKRLKSTLTVHSRCTHHCIEIDFGKD